MVKLVGYGSLLNKKSFSRTIPWREPTLAIIKGYKRVFNLIPSRVQLHKLYDANHAKGQIAVLNVIPNYESELNAAIFEISESELDLIKIRLKSYHPEITSYYDLKTGKKLGSAYLFVGNEIMGGEEILNNDILPIPKYVETCKEGAKALGKPFYKKFLETTFTGSGKIIE